MPAPPGEVYDEWGNLTLKDGVKQGYYDEATGEWVAEVYDDWGNLTHKDGEEQGYYDEETGEWIQTAEYDEKGKLIEYDEYGNIIVKEEPAAEPTGLVEVPAQQDVEVIVQDVEPFEDDEEEAVPDIVMAEEPQPAAVISPPQPSPVEAKKKEQQGSVHQSEGGSKVLH